MLLIITQEWSNIHFNTVKIKANLRDNTVQVMVLASHILPLPSVTFCSCCSFSQLLAVLPDNNHQKLCFFHDLAYIWRVKLIQWHKIVHYFVICGKLNEHCYDVIWYDMGVEWKFENWYSGYTLFSVFWKTCFIWQSSFNGTIVTNNTASQIWLLSRK